VIIRVSGDVEGDVDVGGVDGGWDGRLWAWGWRMAPLGNGTTGIGTNCEPGGGPLSAEGGTWRNRLLSPSRNWDAKLWHADRSLATRNKNTAIWNLI
jgi:hypothetical protein